jgi:hypothetical protein
MRREDRREYRREPALSAIEFRRAFELVLDDIHPIATQVGRLRFSPDESNGGRRSPLQRDTAKVAAYGPRAGTVLSLI